MAIFALQFVNAFAVTVGLALISGILGTAIGMFSAIAKLAGPTQFGRVVTAYTTVVRGFQNSSLSCSSTLGGRRSPAQ